MQGQTAVYIEFEAIPWLQNETLSQRTNTNIQRFLLDFYEVIILTLGKLVISFRDRAVSSILFCHRSV